MTLQPGATKPLTRAQDGWIALSCGAVVGLALVALLRRLLLEGQALSYDAVLYARSLWGIAHGDFNNSVIDYPSLAIHSQLGLLLLAPFARLARSVDVLIAAQALTFAATLVLWLRALLRARRAARNASLASTVLFAAWASVLFVYGMPLVANPFLFDVRPDLLGVLPATAGLLRVAERNRFDAFAVACLLGSALAREEFALVAGAALVLAPVERGAGIGLRARVASAALAAAYFAGNSYLWPRGVAQSLHLAEPVAGSELLATKAMILAVFACTAGGLAALGYRWLGAALPGLGILLLTTWMPEQQLSFHYSMFVAPALLAASFAGYRGLLARPSVPRAWLGVHALALGFSVLASAFPGGARFAAPYFDVHGPVTSLASWRARSPWIAEAHALIAQRPRDEALWLPYMIATPYADRPSIRVLEVDNDAPWQPDTVVLLAKHWRARAPKLREQGYTLTGLVRDTLAIMSKRGAPPPASMLGSDGCESVAITWPQAGLELCNVWLDPSGEVTAVLRRSGEPAAVLADPSLLAVFGKEGSRVAEKLELLSGLLAVRELPAGRTVWARSAGRVPAGKVTLELVDAGHTIPLVVGGQAKERVTIMLLPASTKQ